MENGDFKLTIIEFTAFNSEGEKLFIKDYSDHKGNGKMILPNSKSSTEEAIKSLEKICNTVVVHKVTEYDLNVIGKKETIFTEKFEPVKQLENAAA